MQITELVQFNPITRLSKGEPAPFVGMASLLSFGRFVPCVESKTFSGSGSKFQNGDSLIARITPCLENGKGGQVCNLKTPAGFGSTEFIVLRPKLKADARFVYYLTRSEDFRTFAIQQMSGTSGRQRVSWQSLADWKCPSIEPSERQLIGDVLSVLDDKIELNRRMNATLEAQARAVFRNWFVDFGPVRAKMAAHGREKGEARGQAGGEWAGETADGGADAAAPPPSTPYLSPDLWSLFPNRLNDDGVPKGWAVRTVGDLVEVNPKEPLRRGTDSPYIDMAALPTTGSIHDVPITRAYTSGMRFRNDDTLLARITPCLENGKTAYVRHLPNDDVGWGSTEFIVLRAKQPVPKPVTYLLAREADFRDHAIRSMTGTSGRQRATGSAISDYMIAAPDDERLWIALSDIIAPMFEVVAANDLNSRTLAQTRDLLLPRLMSGELRVTDAAARAEAVL